MATSSTTTQYKELDKLDQSKRREDFLYDLIVGNSEKLDEIINLMIADIKSKYPDRSRRLTTVLDTISTSNCGEFGVRAMKHALLFFALANEPWAIDIVTTRGRVPSDRYKLFFKDSLVPGSQKLLNGELTSLWAYVEELRGDYAIS